MEDHKPEDANEVPEGAPAPDAERPAEQGAPQEPGEAGAPNLEKELEQALRERNEFLDLLRRSRADFSNYHKRVENERVEIAHRIIGDFAKQLLPALDDLDRAFEAVEKEHDPEAFLNGIRLVAQKLRTALQEAGVTVQHPEREPFDPLYHEAVMVEEHHELEPGTVSEVLRKGYLMKGKPLRPAQVKVVKTPTPSPGESQSDKGVDDARKDEE